MTGSAAAAMEGDLSFGAGSEPLDAIGLMSGTSLDGVDAAWLRTDGEDRIEPGPALTLPYPDDFRERLRAILGRGAPDAEIAAVEAELTRLHARAVAALRARHNLPAPDLIGFHGHTILHRPDAGRTWQIGDGRLLAALTGAPVVADFRSADVAAGGEGAPLVPVYHRALAAKLPRPLAILNIGGVANVTWIGEGGHDLLAFDTGPGNAPLDDWMRRRMGRAYDAGGALSLTGRPDSAAEAALLAHPFFARRPPKSLDRDEFGRLIDEAMAAADGAATLAACIAAAAAAAVAHLPQAPKHWLVTGGGRHNQAIMAGLASRLGVPVEPVDGQGWNGDALEAQAFAYLARRHLRDLPISFPGTTGTPWPLSGGRFWRSA